MPLIRKRVSVSISLISGWVAPSVSSSTSRSVGTAKLAAHALDEVGKIELLQADRRNVEGDVGVEPSSRQRRHCAQRGAQPPFGELARSARAVRRAERSATARPGRAPDRPSGPAPRAGSRRAVVQPNLGLVDHVQLALVSSARSKPSTKRASGWRSLAQAGPQLGEQLSSSSARTGFSSGPGHLQAERLAKAEGGFEHSAVEAADDQHRGTATIRRQGNAATRRRPCRACRGRARSCRAAARGKRRGSPRRSRSGLVRSRNRAQCWRRNRQAPARRRSAAAAAASSMLPPAPRRVDFKTALRLGLVTNETGFLTRVRL